MAVPSAPVLDAVRPLGSQVRLKWTRVAGATSYKTYRDAVLQSSGVTTEHSIVSVTPGTVYSFTVKATNGDGDSDASNAIRAAGPAVSPNNRYPDLPAGGADGTVLTKQSGTDGDIAWEALP